MASVGIGAGLLSALEQERSKKRVKARMQKRMFWYFDAVRCKKQKKV
jgi:hypothetical protein